MIANNCINPFTAEPYLDFMFNAMFWEILNIYTYMYVGVEGSKMLTMSIVSYSKVKNLISLINNAMPT